MLSDLLSLFSYDFMVNAFIVGTLVAVCAACVGVPLVLKRCAMIGDGLSHVAFGALAIAMALHTAPLALAVPVVMLSAFVLLNVADRAGGSGDAAIAMVASSALATGITAVSLTEGLNTDAQNYLFGTILAMDPMQFKIACGVGVAVLIAYALFYRTLFAVTFDQTFAQTAGLPVKRLRSLLAMMTAGVIVIGMHLMGALLISSLLVFPAMSAMRLSDRFGQTVQLAALFGAVALWMGLTASFFLDIPAGAAIVLANTLIFLGCLVVSLLKR